MLPTDLMNFDNLILNDLMTGLYRFIPSLLILIFRLWQYSPYCVIECVKEFKILPLRYESLSFATLQPIL